MLSPTVCIAAGRRKLFVFSRHHFYFLSLVRCSTYSMMGRLPQFPGVNAPHLATGVRPWFALMSVADVLLTAT